MSGACRQADSDSERWVWWILAVAIFCAPIVVWGNRLLQPGSNVSLPIPAGPLMPSESVSPTKWMVESVGTLSLRAEMTGKDAVHFVYDSYSAGPAEQVIASIDLGIVPASQEETLLRFEAKSTADRPIKIGMEQAGLLVTHEGALSSDWRTFSFRLAARNDPTPVRLLLAFGQAPEPVDVRSVTLVSPSLAGDRSERMPLLIDHFLVRSAGR
jgi:hypothetical protein